MSSLFLGEISPFGFNYVPEQWGACAGGILPISQNQALFSLLGTHYGGDGRATYGLPDLRGRVGVAQGRHPGSQYDWAMGQFSSSESVTLTETEIPAHTHLADFTSGSNTAAKVEASTDAADLDQPASGSFLAKNDGGRDPGIPFYRADAGAGTVPLGGVTGGGTLSGEVSLRESGASTSFSIMQPTLTVNYCISMLGTYPSRS